MAAMNEIVHLAGIAALEECEMRARFARRFRINEDSFAQTDYAFVNQYRLTKGMVEELVDLLTPFMTAPSRTSALSIERKVFTALRFFASGSYQLDIGKNLNHAVSQSSVSRAIEEVRSALNTPDIFNQYVKFPTSLQELNHIRRRFFEDYDFSGVVGCLDCTHVAIYPPQINNALHPEALYVNRKGYNSINTQLICDADLKILNVNARFPGSTHDSYIWNNSNVLPFMTNLYRQGHQSFYLLGDSGYGVRPWLLTPIADAQPQTPEDHYNQRHRSTRSLIERCNGVLKLRFRCLLKHRVLHYSPEKACRIINACVVLHNMCMIHNVPPVEQDEEIEDVDLGMYPPNEAPFAENQPPGQRVNPDLAAGRMLRNRLIRYTFQ